MSCSKHFLGFHWQHHHWRPRVTASEYALSVDTNMWGRRVESEFVRCYKEDVCETCGATRHARPCMCDKDEGERCAVRLARTQP